MIRSSNRVATRNRPVAADGPLGFSRVFGRRRLAALSLSPLAASAIASAIQTHEGFYPGSVAYRNNNPGNLMYAGQPGATRGAGGFAVFGSYDEGYRALLNQINLNASRGADAMGNPVNTLGDLISSWAPAAAPGNSPATVAAYIFAVSDQTGYDPETNLMELGAGGSPAFSIDSAPGFAPPEESPSSSAWLAVAAIAAAVVILG